MTRTLHAIVFAFLVSLAARPALAQQVVDAGSAEKKIYVAFNMEDWTARHLSGDEATAHADLLKKLGCEVKTAQHNGHTDVSARTASWKVLELDSHEKAAAWVIWFQKSGFETLYGVKVGTQEATKKEGTVREVVQYRLADWKSRHLHKAEEVSRLLALTRGLGCEVSSDSHNGHTDVKMRCPEWMEIELSSHKAADDWQKFLQDMGFETKHEH